MDILGIGSVMTVDEMNRVANNPQLFTRLIELDKEDQVWFACQGYPGGTVIGNKKGSARLDGIHIKLGTRFSLRGKAENNRFNLHLKREYEFRQDLAKGQELIDKHYLLRSVSAPEGSVPEEPNLPTARVGVKSKKSQPLKRKVKKGKRK